MVCLWCVHGWEAWEQGVGGPYLDSPFFCEFDSVVWDHLVDLAVLVAFALRVAD
jgi:hypothetical protein